MNRLIRSYQKLLTNHPFIVQTTQTALLMGVGDVISQKLIEKKSLKEHDFKRTFTFLALGSCLVGPALVVWYRTLSTVVKGDTKAVVLKKVALDQLCFSPTFIGFFLCTLGFAKGHDFEQIKKDISRDYTDILLMNYQLWPLVQLGNFYFTPLQYQTLVVQSVAICWNTYLSWKTRSKQPDPNEH